MAVCSSQAQSKRPSSAIVAAQRVAEFGGMKLAFDWLKIDEPTPWYRFFRTNFGPVVNLPLTNLSLVLGYDAAKQCLKDETFRVLDDEDYLESYTTNCQI